MIPRSYVSAWVGTGIALYQGMHRNTNQEDSMYAFITKSKGLYNLEIRTSSDLSRGETVNVLMSLSKSDARIQAAVNHAQPWNF